MDAFQFLRPLWLLAIIPLALILIFLRRQKKRQSFWQDEIDPHLLAYVLVPISTTEKQYLLWLAYSFAGLITILALAGPSWEQSPPVQLRPDIEPLVVILDLSPSMTADDVYPNRLIAARTKLHTLLRTLPQRPTALVVFSSQAHNVMPLTEDRQLITDLLEYMTPGLMPSQGSHSASGLALAGSLLQQNHYTQGQLLLITDAADSDTIAAAKQQADNGYITSVYAIGTAAGGILPLTQNSGAHTVSRVHLVLETRDLIATARAGHGIYQQITQSEEDVHRLLNTLGKAWMAKTDTALRQTSDSQVKRPRDRGAVFILLLLPLALFMFRPGWLLLLCLCVLNIYPLPAAAMDWTAFWYNPEQRGLQALENEHPEQAEQLFSDPCLIGIAQYHQHKYTAALQNFERVNTPVAHYNRGNTLAHLGRYPEALTAYARAYEMDRRLIKAQKNAKIVQQIMLDLKKPAELTAKKPPAQQVAKKHKQKSDIKKQAAVFAEDLLSTPDQQGIAPPAAKKKPQHDPLSKVSGGATLFSDREQGEVDEGNTIGQTGSEGLDPADARDKIARTGKTAGEGKSAPEKTLANKLLEQQNHTPARLSAQKQKNQTSEAEQLAGDKLQALEEAIPTRSAKPGSLIEHAQAIKKSESEFGPEQQSLQSRQLQERFQSLQHWLDSIDDNPTDLLKEKFRREYKRSKSSGFHPDSDEQPW